MNRESAAATEEAQTLERLLRALPKADLHCHLDGSLRPATILELALERGVRLPAGTVEELAKHVQVGAACSSLQECLEVFKLIYPLLRDAAALERAAYELCEDCAAENIRHVEVRYAPMLNAAPGFAPEETLEAVLRGLRRGLADFGVSSGVIICLYRSHGERENREAFGLLEKAYRPGNGLARPGAVGLDLAGDEQRYPLALYADFFEKARRLGIPATCHAGETSGTDNLRTAMELGVARVGHGTRLIDDPGLIGEFAAGGIALEISLTSNVRTSCVARVEDHPARRLHEAGIPIVLNTDDRGLFEIDLTHEYLQARRLGFTPAVLASLAIGSAGRAFLPEADLERLTRRFDAEGRAVLEGSRP